MSMLSRACGACSRALGVQGRAAQRPLVASLTTSARLQDESGGRPDGGHSPRRRDNGIRDGDGRQAYGDRNNGGGYRSDRSQSYRRGDNANNGAGQGGYRRERSGGYVNERGNDGYRGGGGGGNFGRSQGSGGGDGGRGSRDGYGGSNRGNRPRDGGDLAGDRPFRGGGQRGNNNGRDRRGEPKFGLFDPSKPRQPRQSRQDETDDRFVPFGKQTQQRTANEGAFSAEAEVEPAANSVTEELSEESFDDNSRVASARRQPAPHEGRPRHQRGSSASTSYKALLADTQQELLLPGRNERRDRGRDRDSHHVHGGSSRRDAAGPSAGGRFHRSDGHSVGQEHKDIRKKVQAKKIAEKQEKEVFIPSTVTVQRLAGIFGTKLCECWDSC